MKRTLAYLLIVALLVSVAYAMCACKQNSIEISQDGYWIINGVKTETRALAQDGNDGNDGANGITPTIEIDDDGYWVINGTKTDVIAKGADGKDGNNGTDGNNATLSILDGYWVINGEPTQYLASVGIVLQTDAESVQWKRQDETEWHNLISLDTIKGADGISPSVSISENGYWVINGYETNTIAKGSNGTNGTNGSDGTNGKTPQLRYDKTTKYIQWKYQDDDEWQNLVAAADLLVQSTVSIDSDGYWVIDGVRTDYSAAPESGKPGVFYYQNDSDPDNTQFPIECTYKTSNDYTVLDGVLRLAAGLYKVELLCTASGTGDNAPFGVRIQHNSATILSLQSSLYADNNTTLQGSCVLQANDNDTIAINCINLPNANIQTYSILLTKLD